MTETPPPGMSGPASGAGDETGNPTAGAGQGGFVPPPPPQPPPPPPPMAPPGHVPYPVPAPGNQKAVWALVLGIASIPLACFCAVPGLAAGIVAIVLGSQAKSEIARSLGTQTGSGQATAGLVCGIVGTTLSALLTIVYIIAIAVD